MEQIYYTFLNAIIILYPIVLGCGMILSYKKDTPFMRLFYLRMSLIESAKKFYALIFFIMLLIYNYCCYETCSNVKEVMVAALLSVPFLSSRLTEKILQRLTNYGDLMLSALVFLMVFGLVSGMNIIVVTGLTYLVAALFYPPSDMEWIREEEQDLEDIDEIIPFIIEHYYVRPHLLLADILKHLAQNKTIKKENDDKEK